MRLRDTPESTYRVEARTMVFRSHLFGLGCRIFGRSSGIAQGLDRFSRHRDCGIRRRCVLVFLVEASEKLLHTQTVIPMEVRRRSRLASRQGLLGI